MSKQISLHSSSKHCQKQKFLWTSWWCLSLYLSEAAAGWIVPNIGRSIAFLLSGHIASVSQDLPSEHSRTGLSPLEQIKDWWSSVTAASFVSMWCMRCSECFVLLWIYGQELRSTGVVGVVSIPVKKCFVTVVTIMLVTVNRKLCECLQTSVGSVCLVPGDAGSFWIPGRRPKHFQES